ncbi:MAG: hypothetical protein ACOH1K_01280 [Rhodoglobus sp.]
MTTPMDATAHAALEFQIHQLRVLGDRLSSVAALLPAQSTQWRGPAQKLFDAGVYELHHDLARAGIFIDSAKHRTMNAANQMSFRVG